MKASTSSRRTSHSRSYFSSEISSPVGHFLHIHRLVRDIRQMPWLATGGRITSGYVPKFSSARAKERMSRSRRVQSEMERISGAASWYTPSPKQREKMERNQRRREKYLKHHDHDHDAVANGWGRTSRVDVITSIVLAISAATRRHLGVRRLREDIAAKRDGIGHHSGTGTHITCRQPKVHSRTRTRTEHSRCT